ncbi:hypothetical protein ACJIZ3_014544 [Penstemon smallii]|uniref:Protein PLASTID MOVEMENT IMPAIRED 2 n=1 Tax=Penstemon smallii TaxID=265156 RepID=A0ABD3RN42_9LAMI
MLNARKFGTVKKAVSSYRDRILDGNPATKKFQENYPEKPFTKTRELHQAKRDTTQFNENRKYAESVTAEAESKLSAAKKTVKDLTLRIEESNSRAKAEMGELEKLKMANTKDEGEWNCANSECAKVLRELESVKRELSKLKLDMASVLEEKRISEKEAISSTSKTESYYSSIEEFTKKVEEINEEHVLVELARIEAIKEYEEIEAQRREKTEKYKAEMEETQRKTQNMIQDIEDAKELETKLAITISDINMLEGELNQLKEMDTGLSMIPWTNPNFNEEDEPDSESLLEPVLKELEETKTELVSVKEESFQFMASMDVVRNELRHVIEETTRLKKKEEKADINIQNLSSKLLRAKAKLETSAAAEEKAKSIASNLSFTLEELKSEAETANKERSIINEETATIKAEVQRKETEIDLAEERLEAALLELKAVKSSEAIALENLKELIERKIRNRASASQRSSKITISKFEYDYLTGHAAGAKEVADKKVVAAQAWIEALKASEKEILIKTEVSRREIREQKVEEENEVHKTEQSVDAKKVENDFEKWRQKMEPENALPGRAMNRNVKMTPARRAKARKPASPMIRGTPRAKSFTVKRRRNVMPNLAQFFSGRGNQRNL